MKFIATIAVALAVLSTAAADARPNRSKTRFCDRALRAPRLHVGTLSLEVDRAHRFLKQRIWLWVPPYRATWIFPFEGLETSRPLESLEIDLFELPRDAAFPVTAELRFDGEDIWRREFSRPTTEIFHFPRDRAPPYPGLQLEFGAGEVPSLFGVGRAEVVITSATGAVLVTRPLPQPDWTSLERQIRAALPELESQRLRRRCSPIVYVTAS